VGHVIGINAVMGFNAFTVGAGFGAACNIRWGVACERWAFSIVRGRNTEVLIFGRRRSVFGL
jgi:hypothetical protein